jgi:hypothetical protein
MPSAFLLMVVYKLLPMIKPLQILVTGIAIAGTALVFYNSPFSSGGTYHYSFEEGQRQTAKAKRQRRLARVGFLLILISYVLQVILVML